LFSGIGVLILSILAQFIFRRKDSSNIDASGENSVDNSINIQVGRDINILAAQSQKEDQNMIKIVQEILVGNSSVEDIATKTNISLEEVEDYLDELSNRDIIRTHGGGARKVWKFAVLNKVKLKKIVEESVG
jgi:predicted transcriptional regulator